MKYTAYKTKEKIVVYEDNKIIPSDFEYIEKIHLGEHETKEVFFKY